MKGDLVLENKKTFDIWTYIGLSAENKIILARIWNDGVIHEVIEISNKQLQKEFRPFVWKVQIENSLKMIENRGINKRIEMIEFQSFYQSFD